MLRPGLSEAVFVVVDTETTGTKAETNRVIELSAVKVCGGVIVDRFSELIDPGRAVPRYITDLTGISTTMLYGKPNIAAVMPSFLEFLADGIFVAHNLRFDVGFLNAELARLGRLPLQNDTLCTLRLARRLLKGLPSKGLASVADHYKIPIVGRHRALGDAEATAEVLLRFLQHLSVEEGVASVEGLLAYQYASYGKPAREPRHLRKLREEVLPLLPRSPGVYFMKNAKGSILYIGKAKNLRNRVRSYFTGIEGHDARLRDLIAKVRQVSWEETSCELSALLLESRLIKERQPAYNRASRRYRRRPFLRIDASRTFPRVEVTSYLHNDGAEYFGPLAGRAEAELVMEFINRFYHLRECDDVTFSRHVRCLYADIERCDAPCDDPVVAAAYAAEVQRVRDFLTGHDPDALEGLREAMFAASARLDFEEAARFRDMLHRLQTMLRKQRVVAAPVLAHNAALLLPGAGGEKVQVFLVRYGRHVETLTLSAALPIEEELLLADRVAVHFGEKVVQPDRYMKREVDEVSLLAHWMFVHREALRKVQWLPDQPPESFARAVLQAAAAPWEPAPADEAEEEV